jgi:hypothetical protein
MRVASRYPATVTLTAICIVATFFFSTLQAIVGP